MSGQTIYEAPRRPFVSQMRVHDYLYDSAFIVSGARDYARTAFHAAMESAQLVIQPVYKTMFSELKKRPSMRVVYHLNCRLPDHMDRSYGGYLQRVRDAKYLPSPELAGKDRFKFSAMPRKILAVSCTTPDFHPPSPVYLSAGPRPPRNRGTQSLFRESSAQTIPWQPDGRAAEGCEETPEVLFLDKLEWGPGSPYRLGDLPADFHTTEMINKMRHARTWMDLVEKGQFPRWMKKRDAIITDVETKDWIFREAEIDELQDIRLNLLHRLQAQQRTAQTNKTSKKLATLWTLKKEEMERKIDNIRRSRDRELRKLTAIHGGGGRAGLVARGRSARGMGKPSREATDPTADTHAPLARHGYQARKRHAEIRYDPGLLSLEDHEQISQPPEWLSRCGQDLSRTCSGHHLPRDVTQLCERETKWSDEFLKKLHEDLKKARMGAAMGGRAGVLHVVKERHPYVAPRPSTPVVEAVPDTEEHHHQAALLLQRLIRGRAVQILMYEGRTRAAELTEELKTTHGLQKEDKIRIAKEESRARDYNAIRTEAEQKEDAITALVDELCGGAVSAALDFLEKELRRLKEERRQHAFILIALREKAMREAAEAGRRQVEEHRRREHDEMFRQILGVTQETVDAYLKEIVQEGVDMAAEEDATRRAVAEATRIDEAMKENESMSTAEQNELVAELVQQFLLPHTHKTAARHRIAAVQAAKLEAARNTIFGLIDDAEIKEEFCIRCGCPLDENCRCRVCPLSQVPQQTISRDDPRWKHTRTRPRPEPKSEEEKYPPPHHFRCMLNTLVDKVVEESRRHGDELGSLKYDVEQGLRVKVELTLDAKEMVELLFDKATGEWEPPVKESDYRHYMVRIVDDALGRTEPFEKCPCPKVLPSEIRRKVEQQAALDDPTCRCVDITQSTTTMLEQDTRNLLPSEIRVLEEMRRCKCDSNPAPSPVLDEIVEEESLSDATTSPALTMDEKKSMRFEMPPQPE